MWNSTPFFFFEIDIYRTFLLIVFCKEGENPEHDVGHSAFCHCHVPYGFLPAGSSYEQTSVMKKFISKKALNAIIEWTEIHVK